MKRQKSQLAERKRILKCLRIQQFQRFQFNLLVIKISFKADHYITLTVESCNIMYGELKLHGNSYSVRYLSLDCKRNSLPIFRGFVFTTRSFSPKNSEQNNMAKISLFFLDLMNTNLRLRKCQFNNSHVSFHVSRAHAEYRKLSK